MKQCCFEQSVGYQLNITANLLAKKFAHFLKPYNIAPEQYGILKFIIQTPGTNLTQISDSLYKDKTTTARAVETIHTKGLIEKRSDLEDRRRTNLFATEEGEALHTRIGSSCECIQNIIRDQFSEEELLVFFEVMCRLQTLNYEELFAQCNS